MTMFDGLRRAVGWMHGWIYEVARERFRRAARIRARKENRPMAAGDRIPLARAEQIVNAVVEELRPACTRIEVAGSVRRRRPTIGDLEVVCVPRMGNRPSMDLFKPPEEYDLLDERLAELQKAGRIGMHPERPASGERYKRLWLPKAAIQLDVFIVVAPAEWGVISLIRTGPSDFSRNMVTRLIPRGMRCVDGRILRDNEVVPCPEERDFFRIVELDWLEPEDRK